MPTVGFEPTLSAGERPHTYALDRAATWTGKAFFTLSMLVPLRSTRIYAIPLTPIRKVRLCMRRFSRAWHMIITLLWKSHVPNTVQTRRKLQKTTVKLHWIHYAKRGFYHTNFHETHDCSTQLCAGFLCRNSPTPRSMDSADYNSLTHLSKPWQSLSLFVLKSRRTTF